MLRAFTNGRIETMDVGPQPEVVLVASGRIEGIGGVELLGGRADVEVIDLGGRRLLPGFIDAHHHLSVSALHPLWADLVDVDALDVARERLLDVARVSDAPWIRGCNWSREALRLTRDDLDALGLDRPVVVACRSLHRCVVSSAGLDALGISANTPDPAGGRTIAIAVDGSAVCCWRRRGAELMPRRSSISPTPIDSPI